MLKVQWLLDPMHIEVNVAKNLMKHMYGTNDSREIREEAKNVGVMSTSWIMEEETSWKLLGSSHNMC